MRTYQAFYKNRVITVTASTSYEAQLKAAAVFKARKSYDVAIVLADTPVFIDWKKPIMTIETFLTLIGLACFGFSMFSLGRCLEIMRSIRETNDETAAQLRTHR